MNPMTKMSTFAVPALAILLGAASLAAADKKIQAKDLPPAVQKAIPEETKGATIRGYAKEVEGGKTMYEVETTVNGHSRDLLFDATGRLVEAEEATTLDAVPAAVKLTLEARGKVLSVETVTKGKAVTYEGVVEKNGKKSEVAVTADGKPIKP
jgi:uncharacterized membrane protein YkoI